MFKTLRTFFNAAKKKKLIAVYPFDEYEFPKYISPVKDYLSAKELQSWEKLIPALKKTIFYQAAAWFHFGCYCGLRVSDWHKFDAEMVHGKMIRLQTIKNGGYVGMPITKILGQSIDRVLKTPFVDAEQKINEKQKVIAGKLGITKHLTCHTATSQQINWMKMNVLFITKG